MFESKERGTEVNTETLGDENYAFAFWLYPGWFVCFHKGNTCTRSMSLAYAALFPCDAHDVVDAAIKKIAAMGFTVGIRGICMPCEVNNVTTMAEHDAHKKADIQKRALKKRRATLRAKKLLNAGK